jgi:hypothetical protein
MYIMAANVAVISIVSEAILILVIGFLVGRKLSFSNAVLNGALVMMAGGTLLFGQKPLGFLLLVYSAFIMVAGTHEKEVEDVEGKGDWLGYLVKTFGNYVVTALIVIIVTMISFDLWPF